MKISVVIPAYNAAASIKAAIESCMAQTVQPHEIIVVDDASTDNTVEIAQRYDGITLLQQTENAGPSAARNRGWDEATGNIIAFLDSDDRWLPHKLAIVSDIFMKHSEVQYMGHPYLLPGNASVIHATGDLSAKSYASILLKNPYQPSCITARRSVPERFDESYRYCEDHELSLRLAHKYTCHWLDTPLTELGRPQLSSGGASGNIWNMRKGELRVYTSIYRHNPTYILLVPFLWVFSLGKMLFRLASR